MICSCSVGRSPLQQKRKAQHCECQGLQQPQLAQDGLYAQESLTVRRAEPDISKLQPLLHDTGDRAPVSRFKRQVGAISDKHLNHPPGVRRGRLDRSRLIHEAANVRVDACVEIGANTVEIIPQDTLKNHMIAVGGQIIGLSGAALGAAIGIKPTRHSNRTRCNRALMAADPAA